MNDFTARLLVFFSSAVLFDRSGYLGQAVLWIGRLDLVAIVGCAGLYKLLSGYARGEGMEFGMVNPMWGYAWKFLGALAPSSFVFRFWNQAGWCSELLAAVFLLTPFWGLGVFLVSAGFLAVAGMIRLGRLAFLMAFLPILFFPFLADDLLAQAQRHGILALPAGSRDWVVAGVVGWAVLLLLTKVVQYFNLLKKRRFGRPCRRLPMALVRSGQLSSGGSSPPTSQISLSESAARVIRGVGGWFMKRLHTVMVGKAGKIPGPNCDFCMSRNPSPWPASLRS